MIKYKAVRKGGLFYDYPPTLSLFRLYLRILLPAIRNEFFNRGCSGADSRMFLHILWNMNYSVVGDVFEWIVDLLLKDYCFDLNSLIGL